MFDADTAKFLKSRLHFVSRHRREPTKVVIGDKRWMRMMTQHSNPLALPKTYQGLPVEIDTTEHERLEVR